MGSAPDAFNNDVARNDLLVLVDGLDRQIGVATKERAHREGLLHRAFSVVLRREGERGGELLLARRAPGKYHSAGLWANSCCSHPREGEGLLDAAARRVREELGCGAAGLREVAAFAYRAQFDDGLAEYEYDHVLIGDVVGDLDPDPAEADSVRWVTPDDVAAELAAEPGAFAAWAPMVLTLAMRAM